MNLFAFRTTISRNSSLFQISRNATKKAGGTVKNGRDSNPKYLGLKKSGGQPVFPGHIIIRQRGRKFHEGEGVGIGRDHTLFAKVAGYVKFVRDITMKKTFVHVSQVNPHLVNPTRKPAPLETTLA